ncbi:MAG: histidine--tRNA ligase [Candidatus Aminicenantes bacterium]|nr:histidine--tRNA ligase [Candidatus Aminicenantes bacterium]
MKEPKKTITAIKGTKDILPDEARKWQRVEAATKSLFELYGYREIRTPIFEATELFEKGTGETTDVVTKEMYTFMDKGGRSLTLRPEYTPSVVRAIMDNSLHLKPQPMRYYFIGPMFRYDKPQKGRFRQFHQIDIEVFGEKDPAIDAEIVEMADTLLRRLKVTKTELLVNSVGCHLCRPAYHGKLKQQAEKVREELCEDCQRKVVLNPLRIFDCKVESCRGIADRLPKITDHLCEECAEHFKAFCGYLDLYGIAFRMEPRLVRGLDYYTKTTFEIISSKLGAQDAILGGGRYDYMMKEFGGPDICGIGFAMGMERFLSVVPDKAVETRFLYMAYLGEEAKNKGMQLARKLRKENVECLIEYRERSLGNQMSRANKLGASWVLIIGEEELRKERYQLKDMKTGGQKEMTIDNITSIIRNTD